MKIIYTDMADKIEIAFQKVKYLPTTQLGDYIGQVFFIDEDYEDEEGNTIKAGIYTISKNESGVPSITVYTKGEEQPEEYVSELKAGSVLISTDTTGASHGEIKVNKSTEDKSTTIGLELYNIGGSTPTTGSGQKNVIIYKALAEGATPATPEGGMWDVTNNKLKADVSGKNPVADADWKEKNEFEEGSIIWISNASFDLEDGHMTGDWIIPIRITGTPGEDGQDGINGTNGADGDSVQFVYCLSSVTPLFPTTDAEKGTLFDKIETSGFARYPDETTGPYTWYDRAQTISQENQTEWMVARYKVNNSSSWNKYSDVVIWSQWGEDGTDGDGIEYIYTRTATLSAVLAPNVSIDETTDLGKFYKACKECNDFYPGDDWFNDTNKEKVRVKLGKSEGTEWDTYWSTNKGALKTEFGSKWGWTDNPVGTDTNYRYEYCSNRRYSGTSKSWGDFNTPTTWNVYQLEGVKLNIKGTITYEAYVTGDTYDSTTVIAARDAKAAAITSPTEGSTMVVYSKQHDTEHAADPYLGYSDGSLSIFKYTNNSWSNVFEGTASGDSYMSSTIGHMLVWDSERWMDVGKVQGADGKTYKLFIKYAIDNENGVEVTIAGQTKKISEVVTTDPSTAQYIGTYTAEADVTDLTKYTWSHFKGQDGYGYEYIYTPTSSNSAPYIPTRDRCSDEEKVYWDAHVTDSDFCPTCGGVVWKDDAPQLSDTNKYIWMVWRKKEDTGTWSVFKGAIDSEGTTTDYAKLWSYKASDGQNGEDGATYYTWIKYADDAQGSGLSDDPTGKEYIGFAYNKTTPIESTIPSDYKWSLIKGTNGTNGIDGQDGEDGITYYTWIKYSDILNPTQSSEIYDTPTSNTISIGIAVNQTVQSESTDPSKYTWSKFKGDQGVKGQDGSDGQDGTSIIWQNTTSRPSNPENGWAYYDVDLKKSFIYQDGWYQMTVDGIDGTNGEDGLSIIWKGESSTAPSNPTLNWCYRNTGDGKVYIYNGSEWTLMTRDGNDGTDGTDGEDGLSVFITYHDNPINDPPTTPTGDGTTGGWHTTATSSVIWMSQKVAASSTSGTWGSPIQIQGNQGDTGEKGEKGDTGSTGLRGAVCRGPISFPSGTTRFYNDGTQEEADGLYYIDIVVYDHTYYKCKSYHTSSTWDSLKWTECDEKYKFIATDLLLADNARINFLSGQQIALSGTSGSNPNVCLQGDTTGSDYVFWAGSTTPSNANFSIKADGSVVANSLTLGSSVSIPQSNITNLSKDLGDLGDDIDAVSTTANEAKATANTAQSGVTSINTIIGEDGNNIVKVDTTYGGTEKSFELSTDGFLSANNAAITGKIIATEGHFGKLYLGGDDLDQLVIGGTDETPSSDPNSYFDANGVLHCKGADIKGAIVASALTVTDSSGTEKGIEEYVDGRITAQEIVSKEVRCVDSEGRTAQLVSGDLTFFNADEEVTAIYSGETIKDYELPQEVTFAYNPQSGNMATTAGGVNYSSNMWESLGNISTVTINNPSTGTGGYGTICFAISLTTSLDGPFYWKKLYTRLCYKNGSTTTQIGDTMYISTETEGVTTSFTIYHRGLKAGSYTYSLEIMPGTENVGLQSMYGDISIDFSIVGVPTSSSSTLCKYGSNGILIADPNSRNYFEVYNDIDETTSTSNGLVVLARTMYNSNSYAFKISKDGIRLMYGADWYKAEVSGTGTSRTLVFKIETT